MLTGPISTQSRVSSMAASRYLDRIAISLSTICIVHCLAMPFLVALLPFVALTFGGDGHFHALMLWLVVPTSALGFSLGYRVHGKAGIVLMGALAVAVLALVALWGHYAWDPRVEVTVNVAASILLATAHWRNFREVRRLHSYDHAEA
jgi:hypothetical protein